MDEYVETPCSFLANLHGDNLFLRLCSAYQQLGVYGVNYWIDNHLRTVVSVSLPCPFTRLVSLYMSEFADESHPRPQEVLYWKERNLTSNTTVDFALWAASELLRICHHDLVKLAEHTHTADYQSSLHPTTANGSASLG